MKIHLETFGSGPEATDLWKDPVVQSLLGAYGRDDGTDKSWEFS